MPSLNLPDPQAILDLPATLARTADGLRDLAETLREELDGTTVQRDEVRELRAVAEQLLRELHDVRTELGWVRANLESVQDRVPGLSPPGR